MSAPQFVSGEIGNIDDQTVVIVFDQDIVARDQDVYTMSTITHSQAVPNLIFQYRPRPLRKTITRARRS